VEAMMRYVILVCTILVVTLALACTPAASTSENGNNTGNAGANTTQVPPSFTPTPTADTSAGTQTLRFEISGDDSEINPKEATISANKPYVIEFKNGGKRVHKFQAQRWRVDLFAPAGQSATSPAFSESVAGDYPCFDAMDAARNPKMKCTIKVQ
jgi:hypothetical protein